MKRFASVPARREALRARWRGLPLGWRAGILAVFAALLLALLAAVFFRERIGRWLWPDPQVEALRVRADAALRVGRLSAADGSGARELYEAAAISGANTWQSFRYVTLPLLRGVSSIVLLLSLIWNFQHFETIYVMTQGGPAKATTTFSVAVYQAAFQAFDLGKAGALGILWMLLLSLVVVVYLRFGMGDEEMSA